MAMHIPKTGFKAMMKEGSKSHQGMEEVVYRNIKSCKEFAAVTRSSFGPQGMNKIIVNHLQKRFVTNDATTIVNELELEHPAAKIIEMASKMQEQEVGDGTNFVIQFASSLLISADQLLRMGLTSMEVIDGYKIGLKYALEKLTDLVCFKVKNDIDPEDVMSVITSAVCTKQKKTNDFNVDNVRVVKILGGGINRSEVIQGLVFKTRPEGIITEVRNAKIALYTVAFDLMSTETHGTVLLNTASELSSFTSGEENLLRNTIEGLKKAGITVVITSDKASDQAIDYANRYGIMVVRITSKFDLQRISRATTASILPTMKVPTQEEIGHCSHVYTTEYASTTCMVFKQEREETAISTIILRGSSDGVMDDAEKAIDDGINALKMIQRHNEYVSGAGSVETALSSLVSDFSKTRTDMLQYSIQKFADALEVVPRMLAENAGFDQSDVMSKLYAKQVGEKNVHIGVDINAESADVLDAKEKKIFENLYVKKRGLMLATHAANTILSVDQIIMAKPAGGPRIPKQGPMDQD